MRLVSDDRGGHVVGGEELDEGLCLVFGYGQGSEAACAGEGYVPDP
ncbi:hypothetical protein OG552_36250 [Streptomyces sp. NBC_01476]|nr:hypothetical protein [Streptomyces sp. NBC_01476]